MKSAKELLGQFPFTGSDFEWLEFVRLIQKDAIESAAEIAESYEPHCESCPRGVANAILHLTFRGGESDE